MTAKTWIISVHRYRRVARLKERRLQRWLDSLNLPDYDATDKLLKRGLPSWTRGVRVDPAGDEMWACVATDNGGH